MDKQEKEAGKGFFFLCLFNGSVRLFLRLLLLVVCLYYFWAKVAKMTSEGVTYGTKHSTEPAPLPPAPKFPAL